MNLNKSRLESFTVRSKPKDNRMISSLLSKSNLMRKLRRAGCGDDADEHEHKCTGRMRWSVDVHIVDNDMDMVTSVPMSMSTICTKRMKSLVEKEE